MIVLAARGERVAIWRESECTGRVRRTPQRIKIVAPATLPEQPPLKTAQVGLVGLACPWPMGFQQIPCQTQIAIVQSRSGAVHVGSVEIFFGVLTLFGFLLCVVRSLPPLPQGTGES